MTNTTEPQTLMTRLTMGESPRWHDGRLWFSNWGAREVVAVDFNGTSEAISKPATAIFFYHK